MRDSALRLEPVTSTNWREGLVVPAGEGQAQFVADYEPVLLVILAKSAVRVGGVEWWPFLHKKQTSTVGMVAVADHRKHDRALLIFHLLIDQRCQRQGYGRAAWQQIIELSRQLMGCDTLRLTVNPHNATAIALYQSVGFTVTGTDDDGELQMAKPLSTMGHRASPHEDPLPRQLVRVTSSSPWLRRWSSRRRPGSARHR